jgi:hypothetical protein
MPLAQSRVGRDSARMRGVVRGLGNTTDTATTHARVESGGIACDAVCGAGRT